MLRNSWEQQSEESRHGRESDRVVTQKTHSFVLFFKMRSFKTFVHQIVQTGHYHHPSFSTLGDSTES